MRWTLLRTLALAVSFLSFSWSQAQVPGYGPQGQGDNGKGKGSRFNGTNDTSQWKNNQTRQTQKQGGPGPKLNTNSPDVRANRAEAQFRRLDTNADGVLSYDELSEELQAERDKWDLNKDGFIDLNEFKAYVGARNPASQNRNQDDEAADKSMPSVHRAGRLPKELPAWFEELDTNHDAQVALYEWKHSGRALALFNVLDRNGDGFLTVDEVLHAQNVGIIAPEARGPAGAAATVTGRRTSFNPDTNEK
jgi:Ca2+-binding EF-hand superfamily protein